MAPSNKIPSGRRIWEFKAKATWWRATEEVLAKVMKKTPLSQ
jgi:hypothetical protein